MRPPHESYAAWVYRAAMMLLGLFSMASMIWLHIDISYGDWPPSLAGKRIDALAQLGLWNMALLGIQLIGLVARNLVRNIKLSGPGGFSADVSGQDA